uniref:SFRICE_001500 n=1 Tax=Spodoptera frugiperda TaxID=7108 RepID=A0A2H1V9W5_SPOFR
MTPTQLALAAAAALLVCARAEPPHKNSFSVKLRMTPEKHRAVLNGEPDDGQPPQSRQYFYNSLVDSTKQSLADQRATKDMNNKDPQNLLLGDSHDKEYNDEKENLGRRKYTNDREDKAYRKRTELPSGCLYEGRWYNDGAAVNTREDCLRCVCAHGALSCRRRACEPLPDPLPLRCHVRHRRGFCCPELQCPDGVKLMEHKPTLTSDKTEYDSEPDVPTATPASSANACVEGGSVYAAGSALSSRVACEQCFCLRGARHCVRPSCLPPPQHCAPRPATGACCPQRYYCDSSTEKPNQNPNQFDCLVDGTLVPEGSPVATRGNCSSCFCLRGEVRCQAMGCAPELAGCRPLLAPGDCCAHQYVCDHVEEELLSHVIMGPVNSPASLRSDERTFHLTKATKVETTTKKTATLFTLKHISFASATKNHLVTTAKVKRRTDDQLSDSVRDDDRADNATSSETTTTQKLTNAAKYVPNTQSNTVTYPEITTDQPEAIVKITVNGTINCTAELSSTSLPLNLVHNDTDKIQEEAIARVPIVNVEAQTYSPNDIITDRSVDGGFDDADTFTINVTSSLITNTSLSTARPAMTAAKISISGPAQDALNVSNNKKAEYDYDYAEPTLPPSLPNLKIIPFVAADAVVEDDPIKDSVRYPILERPDKFPVYYPAAAADTKDDTFPIRREDTYQPTQYPIFVMGKVEPSYAPVSQKVEPTRERYPEHNDLGVQEYTVSASLGSPMSGVQAVTKVPTTSTTFEVETPTVNRFSPPVETQGGFIPKGSGVVDDFFGVFTSTEPTSTVPHLTTSMQLDVKRIQGECIATDGRHVPGGESIVMGCHLCTCSWVELVCERRACAAPAAGCRYQPVSNHSADPCCGDITCGNNSAGKNTSTTAVPVDSKSKQNEAKDAVQPHTTPKPSGHNNTTVAEPSATANSNKSATANETKAVNRSDPTATTPAANSTTATSTTATSVKPTNPTTAPVPVKQDGEFSHDDEDEDDEEEFSFGSVLKLLLSDSYETTTTSNRKTTSRATPRPTTAPPAPIATDPPNNPLPEPPVVDSLFFKPLPSHLYSHPKIPSNLNTVHRIDHLVLGEATAITRPPIRPITIRTTKRPPLHSFDTTEGKPVMLEVPAPFVSIAPGGPVPNAGGLLGPGLLKLAGCNIYGRMYRVGRIITELSTPCQECWCTELGVQCKPLAC